MTRAQLQQMADLNDQGRGLEWACGWPRRQWVDALPWLIMLAPWALLIAGVLR